MRFAARQQQFAHVRMRPCRFFRNMPIEGAKRLMGVQPPAVPVRRHVKRYSAHVHAQLPASFDSRTAWPHRIGPVLNQADCGSCWAFGAAEAISGAAWVAAAAAAAAGADNGSTADRIAIAKNETYVQLAPLDLVSCDTNDNGCQGVCFPRVCAPGRTRCQLAYAQVATLARRGSTLRAPASSPRAARPTAPGRAARSPPAPRPSSPA